MKNLLIGGTGTLGKALLRQLKGQDVTVLSRDELKQIRLKEEYPDVKFKLGDVRSPEIRHIIRGKDAVFNLAAIKHVPVAEENQRENIAINLMGAVNVADICEDEKVGYSVFSSTDKAQSPFNVYGAAKMLSENYYLYKNRDYVSTRFSAFRWGNISGSRGSVVHLFAKTLREEHKVYITDNRMTRFWLSIDDVAEFMVRNFETASMDAPMIPTMKAAPVVMLARAVAHVLNIKNYELKEIGIRRGEKLHETMISTHDYCMRSDTHDQFTFPELCEMAEKGLQE